MTRYNEFRFSLWILSRYQDNGPRWFSVTVEVNSRKTRTASTVVLLKKLSVVFVQIGQGDRAHIGVFF